MYGYRRRPMVVRKPPSFLEAFLYSTGIGMERGADRYFKERDRKRGITNQVLEGVLQEKISPELLATDLGRSIMDQIGIGKEPAIQEIQKTGEEKWKAEQPEIGPPAPLTMQHLRSRDEQAKEVQAQEKMKRELFEFEAKEIIKRRVEKGFTLPLDKQLENTWNSYIKAEKSGIAIEDIDLTGPNGEKINLRTHIEQLEKQQVGQASKTKAGIAYLKAWKEYVSIQQVATKAIHNLAIGKDVRTDLTGTRLDILNSILPKKLTEKDVKIQLRNLLPLFNDKLKIQHRILKKQKALARDEDLALPPLKVYGLFNVLRPEMLGEEIKRLAMLGDTLIGTLKPVEKPKEALSAVDTRHIVTPPPPPSEETVDPSEVTEEDVTATNSAGERIVVRNGKWVKVKKK